MSRQNLKKFLAKVILGLFGVYLALCIGIGVFQRRLVFVRASQNVSQEIHQGQSMGFSLWLGKDAQPMGWTHSKGGSTRHSIVVFQGNGGTASERGKYIKAFSSFESDWQVFLFEYPGYGMRKGEPSEELIVKEALSVVDELATQSTEVFVIGESLGTGVASQVASARPNLVKGVLLITPFDRLESPAIEAYPFLPVHWILLDRFESDLALEKYMGPVGVILAGQDQVVPMKYGQKLYNGYQGPKKLWVQPDKGHNTLDLSEENILWAELRKFWEANQS